MSSALPVQLAGLFIFSLQNPFIILFMEIINLQENKMNTQTKTLTSVSFKTDQVISKDGTIIGYRQMGSGPGLILVHGALMSSQNFTKLAETLADTFTVYVPDRRGRGLSGPHGDAYNLDRECEDIQALVSQTKARNIFGLSSGAIVTLQSACRIASIEKVAIYEPPFSIYGSTPTAWQTRFDREVAKGDLAAAMVTAIKATGDFSLMTLIPRFILVPLLRLAVKADEKEAVDGNVPIRALIPTMHYDLQLVLETEDKLNHFKSFNTPVFLLGGSKSRKYLKTTLNVLSTLLPNAKRVELKGLGHTSANNDEQPGIIAQELRRFFT
jgi:pimeloyl-ACP methyl ester carboxylesterase